MSRKGLNIYKRKDGRWEARYIKSRTAQGKPLYGYLYASSYHEARNRLQDVIRLQGNAPNSKEMSKGSVFEFFSIEWLDTFSTSFKESTYIRYRTLIRCYLMPYFQTAKIESITKEHVLDFCKEIETHGKRDGTALSTKTVSDILSVLRRILHYAKAQNIPVDSAIFDINKIYIKALVGANMAKNELQKMREEDEGLDIIITIILVAVGLVLVGILVNYAKKIVSTADSQVNQIGNTVGGLNSTVK